MGAINKKERKLTPKQCKFVDEYIKTGNATQAAINSGYSEKTAQQIGSENLLKPVIKKYIDERMEQAASERIMSAQEALEFITSVARGEVRETVVVGTPEGIIETEKEADIKTRLSAVKEIMKRYPIDERLSQATLKKIEADADIAEKKNRLLEKNEAANDDKFTITIDV